jgi:predicted nucleic acid-binding protein
MTVSNRFLDTNVLLYLLSEDNARADCAENELLAGGVVNVQVLNEFASVATRKLRMAISDIREVLATIRNVCRVVPFDEQTHELGLEIVERYRFSVFDSMLLASALLSSCKLFLTEDLQHGQVIDGRLRVHNPFR